MDSKSLIFFLFSLSFFLSCKNEQEQNLVEFKNSVNPSVFEKFPLSDEEFFKSPIKSIRYPAAYSLGGYFGLFATKKVDSSEQEIEKLKKAAIQITLVYDSCNRLMPNGSELKEDDCKSKEVRIAVPNIHQINFFDQISIDSSSIFLVFNNNVEAFFAEDVNVNLDSNIGYDHGFSNGAIINTDSKEVIFWLIGW